MYIIRNLKNVYISLYYFINSISDNYQSDEKVIIKSYPIWEAFNEFCRKIHAFGPFMIMFWSIVKKKIGQTI